LMSVAAVAMTVVMVGQMTAHAAVIGWFVLAGPVWAIIGSQAIPRRYRRMGFDDSQAHMLGLMTGLVTGPLGLALLWFELPAVNRNWSIVLTALAIWQLYTIFALLNPSNPCVGGRSVTYITQQTLNGLIIGVIYALMSVGLTLIYSVQRVVSFAHGQFYMVGGYFSYYFLFYVSDWVTQATGTEFTVNPIWGIPIAGALTFLIGVLFELLFLRPMHSGQIERAGEYAILITFGFGFFLEYTTLAAVGPFPVRTGKFSDVKRLTFGEFVVDSETLFGPVRLLGDRVFATVIGIVLIGFLLWFLQRTWTGRGLRAVSMDKQAAAVTGVNPLRMNTFAFGLGTMLAGMSGAALIPIFAWVPWVGAEMATRSYVVVVLGGLGSVPGALLGGLIVGVVEALGAGCYPDPSKGAAYKEAFALLIFALVLLLRPTGLFGRKEL
jgi:branched-chain amino acid transport system permease protein